jgi:hypothetical protein
LTKGIPPSPRTRGAHRSRVIREVSRFHGTARSEPGDPRRG